MKNKILRNVKWAGLLSLIMFAVSCKDNENEYVKITGRDPETGETTTIIVDGSDLTKMVDFIKYEKLSLAEKWQTEKLYLNKKESFCKQAASMSEKQKSDSVFNSGNDKYILSLNFYHSKFSSEMVNNINCNYDSLIYDSLIKDFNFKLNDIYASMKADKELKK